jgi:hypothetical protein
MQLWPGAFRARIIRSLANDLDGQVQGGGPGDQLASVAMESSVAME